MKKYKVMGFFSSAEEEIEANSKKEAIEKFEDSWDGMNDLWLSKCVCEKLVKERTKC